MLTVTEDAKELLGMVLYSCNVSDPEVALRLLPGTSEELDLMLDKENEDDEVVMHSGRKVLLVGQEVLSPYAAMTIARGTEEEGGGLVALVE